MTLTRLLIAVGGLAAAAFLAWEAYGTLQVCAAFGANSVTPLGIKMPVSVFLVVLVVLAGGFLLMSMMAFFMKGEDRE